MAQVHDAYNPNHSTAEPSHNPTMADEPKLPYYPRPADSTADEPHRSRSRNSSKERGAAPAATAAAADQLRYAQPRKQPINDAVTNAFDNAHVDNISADLIAQITESVIKQLKVNTEAATSYPLPPLPPPPPAFSQAPASPPHSTQSTSPQMSSSNIYTPPSPIKHHEPFPAYGSPESRGPASPIKEHEEKRPSSRLSVTSETPRVGGRPRAVSRPSTVEETETTLERIWGQLFDSEGNATPRLGQFLRGLAVHMIEDYEPKRSLVVTPAKMTKFYEDMRLPREAYPWSIVFDDVHSHISRMYRELECEHHLVQEPGHWTEKPDIPGLTPSGFEKWASMVIRAHPDGEFERLQKAALALPINNPDDKKERFPKDISRRLFPAKSNLDIREALVDAIEHHADIMIDKSPSENTTRQQSPPDRSPSRQQSDTASVTSDPPHAPNNIERARNPYSSTASECGIDDLNIPPISQSVPTSQPIERERKPYRAAAGGGRQFEDDDRMAYSIPGPPVGIPSGSSHRSSSVASRDRGPASRPIKIPPPPPGAAPPRASEASFVPDPYPKANPQRTQGSQRRRNHSPSPSQGFGRRSEPDVRRDSFEPSSYSSSSGYLDRHDDDSRDSSRRGYGRGPSPARRFVDRAETIDPKRRSMYDTGEEYYRARSNTTGTRPW